MSQQRRSNNQAYHDILHFVKFEYHGQFHHFVCFGVFFYYEIIKYRSYIYREHILK